MIRRVSGSTTYPGFEPVWIETPECTACDECTTLAPKTFAYNDQKLAIVINPKGAKFADIVDEFLEFISGAELVIHNAPFDLGFPGLAVHLTLIFDAFCSTAGDHESHHSAQAVDHGGRDRRALTVDGGFAP